MRKAKYRKKRNQNWVIEIGFIVLMVSAALYYFGFEKKNSLIVLQVLAICYIAWPLIGRIINSLTANIRRRKIRDRYLKSGIKNVDHMTGIEFEQFLEAHYIKQGYRVELTDYNDYGADLILMKDGNKIVVQAKRYKLNSSKVGIKAIQEVISAKVHNKADEAWVVTNNYFTKQAVVLSISGSVTLIDRDQLMELMIQNGLGKEAVLNLEQCPNCGGILHEKRGKHGLFIGCSNYPKCKYAQSV